MSVRGGRQTARGRGRGRGARTMIWEWQKYDPAPEVYDSLFRIRKAPGTIVPSLPSECPIPNAQSRIIRRQQTEDQFKRHYYVVQIIHRPAASNHDDRASQDNGKKKPREEVIHVDTMSIRNYVSLREIERFENAEFRAEAEADAAAVRFEAEELAQRYLAKNARASGTGRGGRMMSGHVLGPDSQAGTSGWSRGRARGRGRKRGRGRGAHQTIRNETGATHADTDALNREDEDEAMQNGVLETEDEELSDDARHAHQSSALARSSFIANSALSLSPVIVPKQLPLLRKTPDDESGKESSRIMSSPSAQLQFEWQDSHKHKRALEGNREDDEEDKHREKRQRTESEQPAPSKLFPSLPHGQPKQPSKISNFKHSGSGLSDSDNPLNSDSVGPIHDPIHSQLQHDTQDHEQAANPEEEDPPNAKDDEAQDEDVEEYVIEAIIDHNYDSGLRYYLVKWEGYEGSTDWLEESELHGAREAIRDYHKKLKMRGMSHSGKRKQLSRD